METIFYYHKDFLSIKIDNAIKKLLFFFLVAIMVVTDDRKIRSHPGYGILLSSTTYT